MRLQLRFVCILSVLFQANGYMLKKKHLQLIPRPDEPDPDVVAFKFNQTLDHFDETGTPTIWLQRAWGNAKFVQDITTAPVFLYIFGEGPADTAWLSGGHWYDWGKEHNAMLYGLEHRYYGESRPTPDVSLENLKYLTTKQALADIANFIDMNEIFPTKRKWVVFGGSYPGVLAAWARLHYPDKIVGAVSSSAPLKAKADFTEYIDVERKVISKYSPECSDRISQAFRDTKKLIDDDTGREVVETLFGICASSLTPFTWKESFMFFDILSGRFMSPIQYGDGDFVKVICDKFMLNETIGSPMQRLAAWYTKDKGEDSGCTGFGYDGANEANAPIDWDAGVVKSGGKTWFFQECNELGYFRTSDTDDAFFGDTIKLEPHVQKCTSVFGDSFNLDSILKANDAVNERNQGMDINVTNVVFLQGSDDPWSPLGMVHSTEESPLIILEGKAHCDDMSGDYNTDPVLKAARAKTGEYLKKWLSSDE